MPRNVLLNPGPATTSERVKRALVVPDVCPREAAFVHVTQRVREQLLAVVNGTATHRAALLSGSGTAAVEAALSSVPGDDARVLVLDNGAYGRRGAAILSSYGISHAVLGLRWGEYPDVDGVHRFADRHGPFTHFFFVHHETTTGMLNPLDDLLEVCRQRGMVSIVDAMSSFAGIPIDVTSQPIDYLIASSNKCIQGFAGIAFVLVRRAAYERRLPVAPRNLYLDLPRHLTFMDHAGEFLFTPPVQVVYALHEALLEFFEETQMGRFRRYCELYDCLRTGVDALGLTFLLPPSQRSRLLSTIVEPPNPAFRFDDMHDYLLREGITIYPGKMDDRATFRIANIGALVRDDMVTFLDHLQSYFRAHQIGDLAHRSGAQAR